MESKLLIIINLLKSLDNKINHLQDRIDIIEEHLKTNNNIKNEVILVKKPKQSSSNQILDENKDIWPFSVG